MVLAAGTAFFKPGLQGSLAQNLNKENSSMGWGIFYWVVNAGSFIGHYLPGLMLTAGAVLPWIFHADPHSKEAWRNLFLASALFTSFNLLLLIVLRDVPSGASKTDGVFTVLWRTISHIIEPRLLAFIIIMSGFWMMMYQLWDLQPNFIADWVDSGPLARRLTFLPDRVYESVTEVKPQGRMVAQQVLLSANSLFIIMGVMLASWFSRKMRTLSALMIGMLMATCGVLIAGWTMSVWVLIGGILFFSLGEMFTGPKINAYLGLIAPPGKKGLYLGYSNIPGGIGVLVGSKISGYVYGHFGEKAVLAQRYLAEKTSFGEGKGWNGDVTTLEKTIGISRPDAMAKLQEVTGMDAATATRMLWDAYHPHYVWIPYALVGVICAIALGIYGHMAKRWADMNA
jgi:MFS family permease